jgi:hypothetical protein
VRSAPPRKHHEEPKHEDNKELEKPQEREIEKDAAMTN